jgi:uncharacterized protein YggU (UPF0235/DUF167 family)
MQKGLGADLAQPGTEFTCRVTPRAARAAIERDGAIIRVRVTAVPEDGKANKAVLKLLATALGVSVSSLQIVRGHSARDKVIRLQD